MKVGSWYTLKSGLRYHFTCEYTHTHLDDRFLEPETLEWTPPNQLDEEQEMMAVDEEKEKILDELWEYGDYLT